MKVRTVTRIGAGAVCAVLLAGCSGDEGGPADVGLDEDMAVDPGTDEGEPVDAEPDAVVYTTCPSGVYCSTLVSNPPEPSSEVKICQPYCVGAGSSCSAGDGETRFDLTQRETFVEYRAEAVNGDQVIYGCAEECTAPDHCRVTHPAGVDLIWFVIDGMAGWFRIVNDDLARVAFFHEGGGSCIPTIPGAIVPNTPDPNAELPPPTLERFDPVTAFADADFAMITPFYAPGAILNEFSQCAGWLTNPEPGATDLRRLALRPARLIEWAHDNLSDGRPFSVVGHSSGSVAAFSAFHWGKVIGDGHPRYPDVSVDLDPLVDAWYLGGGPALWDLRAWCGMSEFDPSTSYCAADPTIACTIDDDCGTRVRCMNTFSYNEELRPTASIIDNATRDPGDSDTPGGSCAEGRLTGETVETVLLSSMRSVDQGGLNSDGDFANRAPMTFALCGDYDFQASNDIPGRGAQTYEMYRLITGPKTWLVNASCGDVTGANYHQPHLAHFQGRYAVDVARIIRGETPTDPRMWQQWYNASTGDHTYTLPGESPGDGYVQEGSQSVLYPDEQYGTQPLYRYFDSAQGDHLFTTEYNADGLDSFEYEALAAYIFAEQRSGTVPLYSYWNHAEGVSDHLLALTPLDTWGESQGVVGYTYCLPTDTPCTAGDESPSCESGLSGECRAGGCCSGYCSPSTNTCADP